MVSSMAILEVEELSVSRHMASADTLQQTGDRDIGLNETWTYTSGKAISNGTHT